ncbi:MAG: hypothetical protein R3182_11375, partial [Draconibacterium sp.]|nr:hypothetical protein [Draconibacterium sp.]
MKNNLPGLIFIASLIVFNLSCQNRNVNKVNFQFDNSVPGIFHEIIKDISIDQLEEARPEINVEVISSNIIKVNLELDINETIKQDDWKINIKPAFQPDFHWSPHLTPTDDHIISQHVFRSPALIISDKQNQLSIIPDLDLLRQNTGSPWYMDLNAMNNQLILGISNYKVKEHVLFIREKGTEFLAGKFKYGFYILADKKENGEINPWRNVSSFLWKKWGRPLYQQGQPIKGSLQPYVEHTYNWAFNNWKDAIWQEFDLGERKVGAPVFIVNVTQSPNYPGEVNEREFRSVWNQAWFSSLRSAQGVFRYARRTNNKELMHKA